MRACCLGALVYRSRLSRQPFLYSRLCCVRAATAVQRRACVLRCVTGARQARRKNSSSSLSDLFLFPRLLKIRTQDQKKQTPDMHISPRHANLHGTALVSDARRGRSVWAALPESIARAILRCECLQVREDARDGNE